MAYDATKDVAVKIWQTEDGLQASVNQYDAGERKFQIGPRMYLKKSGEASYTKVGRLTFDEVVWLRNVIEEAVPILNENIVE
jgi:hypothetical protein